MTRQGVPIAHLWLRPIRLRIPGLLDLVVISDPDQIHWLNQHEHVVREIDPAASWLHRVIDQRLRIDLGFDGGMLPVFRPRADAGRASAQQALTERLETLRGNLGRESEEIADYVSGEKDVDEIGVTVQHWCGRLFLPHYRAAQETYAAARLLAGWPSAPPWRTWKQRTDGRLADAKQRVSEEAGGDLHCIHGTTIGMENVARSVRKQRVAAQDAHRQRLSPDDILRECLVAPPVVLRRCTQDVEAPFLGRPLTRTTVILFLVARAFAASGDLDVAFLADGWSACPAQRVIPEMLRAVWHAAHHDEAEQEPLLAKINTWSRIWQRAVS